MAILAGGPAWAEGGDEAGPEATVERPAARVEGERAAPAAESKPVKEVRPALARRKRNALNQFDPKVFEARGRELQDEFYEINAVGKSGSPSAGKAEWVAAAPEASSSRHWMIWTGAAGLAAIVGGAVGYLMLDQHTQPDPISVHLDDKP